MTARPAAQLTERIAGWQRKMRIVGIVGAVPLVIGAFVDADQVVQSWLLAYLYWVGLSLGSLGILMLHHVTGGAWGFAIRRLLEAGTRTLPLCGWLFLPILFQIGRLYEWSHADVVEGDPILQAKSGWLNAPGFVLRAIVYFGLWLLLARTLDRLTNRYDRTINPRLLRRLRSISAPGIGVYVLTMTFASVDWAMSLEPHWFSSIYGAYFVAGQALATLALAIVISGRMVRYDPFSRFVSKSHFHDLGNLMLAFVMFWAYLAFSQFLIIWSGNLPEETPWYLVRSGHGWQKLPVILAAGKFLIPFLFLISRRTKRSATALRNVAMLVLVMHFVDLYWIVVPAFHPEGFTFSILDVAAMLTIGGLWLSTFAKELRGRPLISLQDAKIQSSLEEVRT